MKSYFAVLILLCIFCKTGRPSRSNAMPETMILEIPYSRSGATIKLNMVKIPDKVDDVKVVVGDKRGSHNEPQNPNKHFSMYKDKNMYATFTVTDNRVDGRTGYTYYGSFRYNGNICTLEPVYPNDPKIDNSFDKDHVVTIDGIQYHLRQKIEKTHGGVDKTPILKSGSTFLNFDKKGFTRKYSKEKQVLTIEILVILDNSVFNKWMALTNNNTHQAVQNMKYYFSEIVNGIKQRYENIDLPNYLFTVALAGFYVAETPEMAPFTESSGVKTPPNILNFNNALLALSNWTSQRGNALPRFDVVALFTNHIMSGINGIAYLSGVCRTTGVSLNKDNGPFQSADTAAHEIGHNVGSRHDGDTNECKYIDQYVMAPGRGDLTKTNYDNPFRFSHCSLRYFLNEISLLNSANENCLEDYPKSDEPVNADKYIKGTFGQVYSLDYQCKIVFGPKSVVYSQGLLGDVDNLCFSILCLTATGMHEQLRPADWTSCALNSWCIRGRCVKDSKAPVFRAKCLYGDSTELINLNSDKQSCKQLINKNPGYCAQKYYRDLCCESCEQKKTSSNKNCLYGDRHRNCDPKYCKSPYYRIVCCQTCKVQTSEKLPQQSRCEEEELNDWCRDAQGHLCYGGEADLCCVGCAKLYDPTSPGCEYGDLGVWCASRIAGNPKECKSQNILKQCCRSCKHLGGDETRVIRPTKATPKSTDGCRDLEDCSAIKAYHCYSAKATNCCRTCKSFQNSNDKNCQFGDRAPWCKSKISEHPEYCKDPTNPYTQSCCATCPEVMKNFKTPSTDKCVDKEECDGVTSFSCYNDESDCCASCKKFVKESTSNCKYGDKFEWCRNYVKGAHECQGKTRDKCCFTCKKYL